MIHQTVQGKDSPMFYIAKFPGSETYCYNQRIFMLYSNHLPLNVFLYMKKTGLIYTKYAHLYYGDISCAIYVLCKICNLY